MVPHNGKLVLLNPDGPEKEYNLSKSMVSLGRAYTNDVILEDVRVSRSHAQLEIGGDEVVLADLGSSNGTRVNGVPIERATIQPGDTIGIGSQQLKFELGDPFREPASTVIDTRAQFDRSMRAEVLPTMVNETRSPALVVFSSEKTWQVDLKEMEQVMIGRDESAIIFIDSPRVSRNHAEVQRVSGGFMLVDNGSTNGTWMEGERVDKRVLEDGDGFQIGPAHLVFKSGFQEQALTMADERISAAKDRKPVVFVPGLMGSELWLGNERVWPNVKTLVTNPEIFTYPSSVPLEARNIVDEIVIVPNLIKQDQYNRLGDYLVEELRYTRGVDLFEFPYDWRQDVRVSAAELGKLIEDLDLGQPVFIIAHSLGTMVSRYYIERLGGARNVERAILMGGPHKGAVKGLVSMLVAPDVLPFGMMGERLRKIQMTFPSSYQILPDYEVGRDQNGEKINFLEDTAWLPEDYLPLLEDGRAFRRELRESASISSISIFGYGIKTNSGVRIVRDSDGALSEVGYMSEEIGDGSVLEKSAFLAGGEIHPVHQHHGSLFTDNDVKMRLKLELTRAR